jgi:branched-chain amino acid transport system ATP-binding protein
MTAILSLAGVHTYYAKSHILHDVNFSAEGGEIVTLLGRNGAGKTTTLRSIMGLTPAREGRITLFGEDITRLPPFKIAAMGVGYVPEGRRVFGNLTVEENLLVPVSGPSGRWTLPRVYDLFPRLHERRASKARTLSGGEQEMLAIARALLVNPRLLILDEPSQGLAPLIVRDVFRTVKEMRNEGITILLVEQNVRAAVEIAERAFVMDDGRIVWSGPAAEFAADEERVRALAGASATAVH